MSSFGFLLIQSAQQILITGKTLYATIVRQQILVQLEYRGGILKSKKSKFDKTILKAYRGDDESYRFIVELENTAFDISTYQIYATARQDIDSPDALFEIQILDNANGSDFANGVFVLVVPNATTDALPSLCNFDIEARLGGTKTTLVSGEIQTSPDVTD